MKETIYNIIKDKTGITITSDTDSLHDSGLDSIDFIDIVLGIEDEFSVKIDMESLNRNTTIEELVTLVKSLKNG